MAGRGAASLHLEGCPQIRDPPRRQRKSDETVPGLAHSDLAPEIQGTMLGVPSCQQAFPTTSFSAHAFFPDI